jgi:Domain of unknown function (DUF4189)
VRGIVGVIFGGVLLAAQTAAAGDGTFGAIVYDPVNDMAYAVTDLDTQDDAVAKATADCRKQSESCQVPLWFQNGCGAIERASNGSWGTGWGNSQDVAISWAQKVCTNNGGTDCRLKIVMCSPGA